MLTEPEEAGALKVNQNDRLCEQVIQRFMHHWEKKHAGRASSISGTESIVLEVFCLWLANNGYINDA
jgi:hypothetical protein